MRLRICTNSKPGLYHSKMSGHSASCCFQTGAGESSGWMSGRSVWKGFCDQPPYLSSAALVPIVTSWLWNAPLLSAVLIGAARGGLPACFWGSRIWQGTGNSQVTVNKCDCFFVYQISHHNVNSEPSPQPKPPTQLPNYEDVRLQKQVCKKCRQKAPTPLSSPHCRPFVHCQWGT